MSHLTGADCALDVVKLFLQYHAMLLFFFLIWEKTSDCDKNRS